VRLSVVQSWLSGLTEHQLCAIVRQTECLPEEPLSQNSWGPISAQTKQRCQYVPISRAIETKPLRPQAQTDQYCAVSSLHMLIKDSRIRALILAGAVIILCGCDGMYFRRIEIRGSDAAAFAVDGQSTQAVVSTLRAYAAGWKLSCNESSALPFECRRVPISVRAVSTQQGVSVCYFARGTQFERKKFEAYIQHLEEMLVSRFGAASVTAETGMC
jgi:hypothetical protein